MRISAYHRSSDRFLTAPMHIVLIFSALALGGALSLGCFRPGAAGEIRTIALTATPVPLDPADPAHREPGRLRFLTGYHLTSDDGGFGGFSGLVVDPEGRWLVALSDRGRWLTARLGHAADGTLETIDDARLGPLLDEDGAQVEGRDRRDAEELVALEDGSYLVAFEGEHRLERYSAIEVEGIPTPAGIPKPFPFPEAIREAEPNSGMEAVARLADGRLLVLGEGLYTDDGDFVGWLGEASGSRWQRLTLALSGKLRPTSAAGLPSGDVLISERSYSEERGAHARVLWVERGALQPGARLEGRALVYLQPPLTLDNFEALAVRPGRGGSVLIYLLSDDNFNSHQRTLLLQFEARFEEPSADVAPTTAIPEGS